MSKAKVLILLNFFASHVYAANCPQMSIASPASGWQFMDAPDGCNPETMFSCKEGRMSAVQRIRPGATDRFQARCVPLERRTPSHLENLREEASRQGISVAELDQRLRKQREVVEPSPIQAPTPQGKQLTASTSMTTQVASAEGKSLLALTQTVKEKAKQAGVPDVVLERAFENYKQQLAKGETLRSCFMAADLTTPDHGQAWIICTSKPEKVIKMPSYFGSGAGANCTDDAYQNKEGCAKYFSNKKHSCLPMGGRFITGPATRSPGSKRNLVELKGLDGFNNNATSRRIGIHRAVYSDGKTPYAVENNTEASNGCFVLPPDLGDGLSDLDLSASQNGKGMTFYVYPEPQDIKNLVEGKPAYWNSSCKQKITNPVWFGKDGVDHLDPKTTQKDEIDFINGYYQEEAPEEPAAPAPATAPPKPSLPFGGAR